MRCGTQKAHLVLPVQEPFCRSVWCGRVQNRGQDRGWAPLNTSYRNTTSSSSKSRPPAHRASPLSVPALCSHPLLPPPVLFLFSSPSPHPPPSSASSPPAALLPPPSSSCVGSRPCSQSPSLFCPGNGVRLVVQARRRSADFLPEVWVMEMEKWKLPQMSGRVERSYLAELLQLSKQLVVNIERLIAPKE